MFSGAILTLGGRVGEASREAYAAVERAYAVGDRAYHNLDHVAATLDVSLLILNGEDESTRARVVLALVYHDAIYDPRATNNEARSAAFARRALEPLGVGESDLAEIERLILVTRDHRAHDPVAALVVDADLAVLQSAPAEYDRYAAAIRQEYAFVPDAEYRVGRTRVLQSLMARRLFTSPLLDEEAARANMAREIASLR